ncbi:MAG: hypothetical protein GY714_08855 [Desulfobacterales bacterium]|nr:hypothetical protein [Desulfobacterales bacterium]MCP4163848.1 hypothetical protein [Deltaproteobacteria bacterium]
MGLKPKGEILKNAIEWISHEKVANPDMNPLLIADKAAIRFNLTPKDSEFLYRFVKDEVG